MFPFLGVPTSAQGRQYVRTALFGPLFLLMGEDAAVVAFRLVPRCNEREENCASYCNQAGHLIQLKKCHWTGLGHFQSQAYFPLFAYSLNYNFFPLSRAKSSPGNNHMCTTQVPSLSSPLLTPSRGKRFG